MTRATDLITAERERQITEEHYDEAHDQHHADELAMAGAAYASLEGTDPFASERLWPWDAEFWKPKDSVRNLTRAGALIAAALDDVLRLDTEGEGDGAYEARLDRLEKVAAAANRVLHGAYHLPEYPTSVGLPRQDYEILGAALAELDTEPKDATIEAAANPPNPPTEVGHATSHIVCSRPDCEECRTLDDPPNPPMSAGHSPYNCGAAGCVQPADTGTPKVSAALTELDTEGEGDE